MSFGIRALSVMQCLQYATASALRYPALMRDPEYRRLLIEVECARRILVSKYAVNYPVTMQAWGKLFTDHDLYPELATGDWAPIPHLYEYMLGLRSALKTFQ